MRPAIMFLEPEWVRAGRFRHPRVVPPLLAVWDGSLPIPYPDLPVCETRLPANFCTCGCYALFVADDTLNCSPFCRSPRP